MGTQALAVARLDGGVSVAALLLTLLDQIWRAGVLVAQMDGGRALRFRWRLARHRAGFVLLQERARARSLG
eukprot:scaffold83804_cov63-Phaeocystis_antarctica.AAC.3